MVRAGPLPLCEQRGRRIGAEHAVDAGAGHGRASVCWMPLRREERGAGTAGECNGQIKFWRDMHGQALLSCSLPLPRLLLSAASKGGTLEIATLSSPPCAVWLEHVPAEGRCGGIGCHSDDDCVGFETTEPAAGLWLSPSLSHTCAMRDCMDDTLWRRRLLLGNHSQQHSSHCSPQFGWSVCLGRVSLSPSLSSTPTSASFSHQSQ